MYPEDPLAHGHVFLTLKVMRHGELCGISRYVAAGGSGVDVELKLGE